MPLKRTEGSLRADYSLCSTCILNCKQHICKVRNCPDYKEKDDG